MGEAEEEKVTVFTCRRRSKGKVGSRKERGGCTGGRADGRTDGQQDKMTEREGGSREERGGEGAHQGDGILIKTN